MQTLQPWRELVSPLVLGTEHLPDPAQVVGRRALVFVGNHQRMGLYDMPLLMMELYVRGFQPKGLAHPGHWAGPLGPFFEQFGAVKAGPMTAYRLLRNKEAVLLFPGGAREVVKRRGEDYQIFWRDSPDFVRLAAKCNALIVPFAAVGADDAYDIIMDTDEILRSPFLGPLAKGLIARVDPSLDPQESVLPLTRLPGTGLPAPFPVPNLQRLYFKFCEPIDTSGLDAGDREGVQAAYEAVRGAVTQGMDELLVELRNDEDREVGARLGKALRKLLPALGVEGSSSSSSR